MDSSDVYYSDLCLHVFAHIENLNRAIHQTKLDSEAAVKKTALNSEKIRFLKIQCSEVAEQNHLLEEQIRASKHLSAGLEAKEAKLARLMNLKEQVTGRFMKQKTVLEAELLQLDAAINRMSGDTKSQEEQIKEKIIQETAGEFDKLNQGIAACQQEIEAVKKELNTKKAAYKSREDLIRRKHQVDRAAKRENYAKQKAKLESAAAKLEPEHKGKMDAMKRMSRHKIGELERKKRELAEEIRRAEQAVYFVSKNEVKARTKLWFQIPLAPIKRPARRQAAGSTRRRTISPGSRMGGRRDAKRSRKDSERSAYVQKYRRMLKK